MADPQRQLIGSIGAHLSWARTPDRSARTAPARRAFADKFDREVDPDGTLSPEERGLRAQHAKAAYYRQLALKSAKVRRGGKSRRKLVPSLVATTTGSSNPITRSLMSAATSLGWSPQHPSEAQVAIALHQLGYRPLAAGGTVVEQHGVNRWRVDFAIPSKRLAIEADGWVHTAKSVKVRDAERDADLAGSGWRVIRINTDSDDVQRQLAEVLPPPF